MARVRVIVDPGVAVPEEEALTSAAKILAGAKMKKPIIISFI